MIHPPVCDHAYEIWLPCETTDAHASGKRACDTSIGMPLGCATHLWHALLHIPLPPASINALINALSRSTVWPPQINRCSNMYKELVVRIKISSQKKLCVHMFKNVQRCSCCTHVMMSCGCTQKNIEIKTSQKKNLCFLTSFHTCSLS